MFQDLSSLTDTQYFLHFNSSFSLFALLPLYIYIYTCSPSCNPILKTHRPKTISFIFNYSVTPTSFNIIVSSNSNLYKLATTFVGIVNDVIDCKCLEYVFCYRIKEK